MSEDINVAWRVGEKLHLMGSKSLLEINDEGSSSGLKVVPRATGVSVGVVDCLE